MMTEKTVPRTSAVELLGPLTVNWPWPTSLETLFQVFPKLCSRSTAWPPPATCATLVILTVVEESIRVTEPSP